MKLFKRILPAGDRGDSNRRGSSHSDARALVAAGDRARDARDWHAAAGHYRRALEAAPAMAAIWVQYGHALKESGELGGAREAYRRAIAMAPEVADTHLQLGHADKLAGDLEQAAASYAQALALQPGSDDALREVHALALRGVRVDAGRLRQAWDGAAPAAHGADRAEASEPGKPRAAEHALALLDTLLAAARAHEPAPPHAAAARQAREQLAGAAELLRSLDAQALLPPPGADAEAAAPARAVIVFDATDLIHHLRASRLPTGIQRVQLELISAFAQPERPAPRICYLGEAGWLEAPAALFARLCRLCLQGGGTDQGEWRQALMQLDTLMLGGAPMDFPHGAWLVSLGTSWFPDYLLHVRLAKRRHGIRYVPFVHDLIPLVMPEHCVDDLVERFGAWLLGAFAHADRFLVNSASTRGDLLAAAARLGHALPAEHIEVIRLDADIRKPGLAPPQPDGMQGWGWNRQPFVLLLSTVEPRKNHLAALRAWRALIDRHGARRVPHLVCAGGKGWKNEAVFALLERDATLAARVTMLSGLDDAQLARLFERCLFTLYPSLYEGWGLPVTESLCHGKVPLVSAVASLPEAGGDFADYFDPAAPQALAEAAQRLIFDARHRQAREAAIRAGFRPRRWRDLGRQLAQALDRWSEAPASGGDDAPACAPRLAAGRYYPLATAPLPVLRGGTVAAESLRAGDGWHTIEPWGCWSRPGDSRLALRVDDTLRGQPLRLYLCLRGVPGRRLRYRLEYLAGGEGSGAAGLCARGTLDAGETRWVTATATAPAGPGQALELCLHSDGFQDLSEATQGADRRMIGPALLGLYLCAADDVQGRLRLVEAVALGNLDVLAEGGAEIEAVEGVVDEAGAVAAHPPRTTGDSVDIAGDACPTSAAATPAVRREAASLLAEP
ncbi:hypothetical protein BKK79_37100 (plasmid) [Cupriavidus sp. USMAA2-4]|uniref:glycosyltransferase n=1 Tax=Cupriavidus sp. USMAA2-4 TaxID=876364 RepID=UPI0008A682C2|nr:glycosyltransferase [Cupriavidus sp. USMAA2-4]AOY97558.1 hypothetical protein BKK79_37100 [Cupriavidus sp. USMAA2-4]